MSVIDLQYVILDERLRSPLFAPFYATEGSAAIDLRACVDEPVMLTPGAMFTVSAGIAIHLRDPGLVGLIAPRSGLGTKGLVLGNTLGVIDSDYIGPLKLSLLNRGTGYIQIDPMMRVAQLLIVPVMRAVLREVYDFEATERGEGGFGSTGIA